MKCVVEDCKEENNGKTPWCEKHLTEFGEFVEQNPINSARTVLTEVRPFPENWKPMCHCNCEDGCCGRETYDGESMVMEERCRICPFRGAN